MMTQAEWMQTDEETLQNNICNVLDKYGVKQIYEAETELACLFSDYFRKLDAKQQELEEEYRQLEQDHRQMQIALHLIANPPIINSGLCDIAIESLSDCNILWDYK